MNLKINLGLKNQNKKFDIVVVIGIVLILSFSTFLFGLGNLKTNQVYVQQEAFFNFNNLKINLRLADVKKTYLNPKIMITLRDPENLQQIFSQELMFKQNKWGDFTTNIDLPHLFHKNRIDILIKGEKHRQFKFEQVKILPEGVVDLTIRPLIAGDISNDFVGQDYKIDKNDYYNLISEIGLKDDVKNLSGDLNYDGVVNSMDRSIMLKNWLNK